MLSAEDNELLTRTGPGTAMGDFFRRFWMPVLLSQELPEPDGPPVRVKVLGEDLVAFRDTDGRVGLLDPRCPHRGANLFFGRNEKCGLRCAYHGWKYDVTGRCVDMPTMPPESTFRDRIRASSYPAREWGEFVWAYLGPAGHEPELPGLEFALLPPTHRFVSKKLQQCNWAQACEGAIDTAHFSFLHMPVWSSQDGIDAAVRRSSVDAERTRWMPDDARPEFAVVPHDGGVGAGCARQRLSDRSGRTEAPHVHGHPGRVGAGRDDPRQPGPHRGPHARAPRSHGRGGHRVPHADPARRARSTPRCRARGRQRRGRVCGARREHGDGPQRRLRRRDDQALRRFTGARRATRVTGGVVTAVSRSATHTMTKPAHESIRLL